MTVPGWKSFEGFDSATVFEAGLKAKGRVGALPSGIKPVFPETKVVGTAYPVISPPRDNLWLHRAIVAASPEDVLVVSVGGYYDCGYWGEIMSVAAQSRNLAGLVIDGCVRDYWSLKEVGFPIFCRGRCIKGTGKDPQGRGALGTPVLIGDVVVRRGDIVLGDADGVVVVGPESAETTLASATQRRDHEASIVGRMKNGETTMEVYGLPAADVAFT